MPLSDFIVLQRGFDLPHRKRVPGPYKVLSSGEASGWHNEGPVQGPGFVVGRATNIGRPTWSDADYWPLNTVLYAKDFFGNDPKFSFYWFLSTDLTAYNSGSVQPMLNRNYIAHVPIDVPPLPEQRRIAATLGALDDKIESNRRAQALIEQLVQARFEAAFSVDDDPDGEPISSLVTVNPRRTIGRGQFATYVGMSLLPEHAAEVMDWDVKEFGSGQKFVNGDVLMARITPCLENGKTAVVDMLEVDEVGWGSTEYIVLAPRGDVSTPWIYCLVRSEPVRAYAVRSMTGTSGRQRFQSDGFDKYRVPVPDKAALRAFNAQALPLFHRMTSLRDERRALARLRDTLLPQLLSGRIRVPEALEAAEAAVG